jgi:hypothetical protein
MPHKRPELDILTYVGLETFTDGVRYFVVTIEEGTCSGLSRRNMHFGFMFILEREHTRLYISSYTATADRSLTMARFIPDRLSTPVRKTRQAPVIQLYGFFVHSPSHPLTTSISPRHSSPPPPRHYIRAHQHQHRRAPRRAPQKRRLALCRLDIQHRIHHPQRNIRR